MHEAVAKPRRSYVGDPRQGSPLSIMIPSYRQDTADWLLTDNVSSWPGTPSDRGWRYLKLALERHDGPDTDYRYNKAVLEAILSHDRVSPPPPWLIHTLEVSLPPHLTSCGPRLLPPFPLCILRTTTTSSSSVPACDLTFSRAPWNTRYRSFARFANVP